MLSSTLAYIKSVFTEKPVSSIKDENPVLSYLLLKICCWFLISVRITSKLFTKICNVQHDPFSVNLKILFSALSLFLLSSRHAGLLSGSDICQTPFHFSDFSPVHTFTYNDFSLTFLCVSPSGCSDLSLNVIYLEILSLIIYGKYSLVTVSSFDISILPS